MGKIPFIRTQHEGLRLFCKFLELRHIEDRDLRKFFLSMYYKHGKLKIYGTYKLVNRSSPENLWKNHPSVIKRQNSLVKRIKKDKNMEETKIDFKHTKIYNDAQLCRYSNILNYDIIEINARGQRFYTVTPDKQNCTDRLTIPFLVHNDKINSKPQNSDEYDEGPDNQTVYFNHVRITKPQQADRYFMLLYQNVKYIIDKCGTVWRRSNRTYEVQNIEIEIKKMKRYED